MLTIENDAITVANIFPRKSAGVWFIKIVIPTAIVVPPTSPAKKRNVRRRGKLVVNVVNSVAMASSTILAIKKLLIATINPVKAIIPDRTAPDVYIPDT